MKRWREVYRGFFAELEAKLDWADEQYGDKSFDRPTPQTIKEIKAEVVDLCGWSIVAWHRLNLLEQKLSELEEKAK